MRRVNLTDILNRCLNCSVKCTANQDEIEKIYRPFISHRKGSKDEVTLWCCIAHNIQNEDTRLYASLSNGNPDNPQSETTLKGWQERRFPIGYTQDITLVGKSAIKTSKDGLDHAQDKLGAKRNNAYMLTWNGCNNGLMGSHTDFSWDDVDGKGVSIPSY